MGFIGFIPKDLHKERFGLIKSRLRKGKKKVCKSQAELYLIREYTTPGFANR